VSVTSSSSLGLIGARIDGQFEIEAVLGGGAFATVYRARQLGIERPVAIKVPSHEIATDPVMAKRFAREARAAARIRHPGVVTIYAVGELPDGRPYMAMELVDGEPLTHMLADGPVAPGRALRIARLIASALSDTHAADVIHRDLKPQNIIWRRDRNGDDRIVIVDFGIAVSKPGNADATRLTAGGLIGTPHYMSPEQAHGEEVDGRADLYALGCILFELVTGATPFDGSSYEVMLSHLGKAAPSARELAPWVTAATDELIALLLAKRPEDRPATADAVVALIDGTGLPRPGSAAEGQRGVVDAAMAAPELDRAKWAGSTINIADTVAAPQQSHETEVLRGKGYTKWLVGGGLAAVVMIGVGVKLLRGDTARPPAPSLSGVTKPGERQITRDDGETSLHMTVPDPIRAGQPISVHFQLWNKLGQPITEPPVITIEDPRGKAKGFNARPVGVGAGSATNEFELSRTLRMSGRYVVRVFPAGTDSELDVELTAAEP
jgi:tRNA A-37 threonylcarbamoyl transferase component Bud32